VWPFLHRHHGECVPSFGFYNDTALLAPVTDVSLAFRFNLIKLIVLPAMYLTTLGAIPLMQFVGVDSQMAVPAPQHIFLFRQQDKGEVPA
jgi:hypothetical protein